tara:strand:- start:586 stop:732 length:147 start_codon:yes stop_codon:yes gene_type:complete
MNNKTKEQIKTLVSQAMGARSEFVPSITKSRIKELVREEIACHYGEKK